MQLSERRTSDPSSDQKGAGKCSAEDSTSGVEGSLHSADEGELPSEEETDPSDDKSSEEGEISSEIEEVSFPSSAPSVFLQENTDGRLIFSVLVVDFAFFAILFCYS